VFVYQKPLKQIRRFLSNQCFMRLFLDSHPLLIDCLACNAQNSAASCNARSAIQHKVFQRNHLDCALCTVYGVAVNVFPKGIPKIAHSAVSCHYESASPHNHPNVQEAVTYFKPFCAHDWPECKLQNEWKISLGDDVVQNFYAMSYKGSDGYSI